MSSWGSIFFGAVVSAVVALAVAVALARERGPMTLALVTLTALLGPIAWNAVLHSAGSDDFFVDAPVAVFPVSWQDVGTGVWTLALAGALQGLSQKVARRGALLALCTAVPAFLVDIDLY